LFYRSVLESDFGIYELKATFQIASHTVKSKIVTLNQSEFPQLIKGVTIVWVNILILVAFIGISLIIFWQYPYVKFYHKKYFAAYVKGKDGTIGLYRT